MIVITPKHLCELKKCIGYCLEALVVFGLFCKSPLNATLKGVTSNNLDPSVDHIKSSMLPVIKKFILDDEGLDLTITKRGKCYKKATTKQLMYCFLGMLPLGGGEVVFKCPVRKQLRPVQLLESGMVKRVRGSAYALRVSPAIANRMVDAAKSVLLNFIPDVYINTDQRRGKQSGKSPGFGMNLIAETTNGTFYSAESVSFFIYAKINTGVTFSKK